MPTSMPARGSVHIGTSGWHYQHWLERFYPPGLPATEWLKHYSTHFRTIEINSSFYRLPGDHALDSWRRSTPEGFVFSIKASRFITHMKKLKEPEISLPPFLRQADRLGNKLGPILFQLPPHWRLNPERLDALLQALPKRYRCAFEFRDPAWFDASVYSILEKHRAAFCIYDLDQRLSPLQITADIVYIRLHGPSGPYQGNYDERTLGKWAERIRDWQSTGKQVYCYFDNDQLAYAPHNALTLQHMLG